MKEESEETTIFVISMSCSMREIFPKPIEMDELDEIEMAENNNNNEGKNISKWSICANIIRLLINGLIDWNPNCLLIKYSNIDAKVSRVNVGTNKDAVSSWIREIENNYLSTGESNPKIAVEEIQKEIECNKNNDHVIHWFIDAESFVNCKKSIFENFKNCDLTVYVIGGLSDLYEQKRNVHEICEWFESAENCEIHFLISMKKMMNIHRQIKNCGILKRVEIPVEFSIGYQKSKIILNGFTKNMNEWKVEKIELLGILTEIELAQTEIEWKQRKPGDIYYIQAKDDDDGELIYMLAEYLATTKPMVAFCQCWIKSEQMIEYSMIMPINEKNVQDNEDHLGLMLTRLKMKEARAFLDMEPVEQLGDLNTRIVNEMAKEVAPTERFSLKKRYQEIKTLLSSGNETKFREEAQNFLIEYKAAGNSKQMLDGLKSWLNSLDPKIILEI